MSEGSTVAITCHEGFEFDVDIGSSLTFVAHCVSDATGGSVVNGIEYKGVLLGEDGSPIPSCVPVVPDGGGSTDEVEMTTRQKGLYSECAKWRNNKDGVGDKNDLSLVNQLKQFAYCMQQDCMYSMTAANYGCRYTDGDQ